MNVFIPSPLHRYTQGHSPVEVEGETIDEALQNLDEMFPGIRFRMIDEQGEIREHIRIFVNNTPAANLQQLLQPHDTLHILAALSGG